MTTTTQSQSDQTDRAATDIDAVIRARSRSGNTLPTSGRRPDQQAPPISAKAASTNKRTGRAMIMQGTLSRELVALVLVCTVGHADSGRGHC
jgi:hypothetical protein